MPQDFGSYFQRPYEFNVSQDAHSTCSLIALTLSVQSTDARAAQQHGISKRNECSDRAERSTGIVSHTISIYVLLLHNQTSS